MAGRDACVKRGWHMSTARCLRCGTGIAQPSRWSQPCRHSHYCSFLPGGRENELVDESDAESIYESRKLLIRQMQGQIAKQVRGQSWYTSSSYISIRSMRVETRSQNMIPGQIWKRILLLPTSPFLFPSKWLHGGR